MATAAVGKIAPNFDLETDGDGRVKLSDLAGKKVVVYFYPADDTSGCTLEAIDFTKASRAFDKERPRIPPSKSEGLILNCSRIRVLLLSHPARLRALLSRMPFS